MNTTIIFNVNLKCHCDAKIFCDKYRVDMQHFPKYGFACSDRFGFGLAHTIYVLLFSVTVDSVELINDELGNDSTPVFSFRWLLCHLATTAMN